PSVVASNSLPLVFGSRRRHTTSKRDWSSDVCSSDLGTRHYSDQPPPPGTPASKILKSPRSTAPAQVLPAAEAGAESPAEKPVERSEERRVGKECRSRGRAWEPHRRAAAWREQRTTAD